MKTSFKKVSKLTVQKHAGNYDPHSYLLKVAVASKAGCKDKMT